MEERELRKRNSYRNTIRNRGITELIHFTRIENIPSILRNGIVPREESGRLIPAPIINDFNRSDGFLDASCISVSFPNYRMFYSYRQKNEAKNWAVISLSPALLTDLSIKEFYFFEHNAARSGASRCTFEGMFGDSNDKDPKDPEAEILAFGTIPTKYIRKIYVENQEALEYIRRCHYTNVEIKPFYFSYRQGDYR